MNETKNTTAKPALSRSSGYALNDKVIRASSGMVGVLHRQLYRPNSGWWLVNFGDGRLFSLHESEIRNA